MTVLVGVHGVGHQQAGRHQLLARWSLALADGLERAYGATVAVPDLDIAFYGDLVWQHHQDRGKGVLDGGVWEEFDDDELRDLAASMRDLIGEHELAAAEQLPSAKGYTRVPQAIVRLLSVLDTRFGPTAVVLFVSQFRQVRRYLREPLVKAEVDARVRGTVGGDCRVLIGHSLGSVVAFEFVRQNPEHRLDLLLTLGSPLGLRMVRERMADPGHGSSAIWGVPGNVSHWVNVRDVHDPVACAGDLTTWWPGVVDRHVVNQGDAHCAERYLGKRVCGQAILAAVPDLVA
ncbi:MAG TPA: hypothetical protein VFC00_08790 [Micromonosporaceae bacterium]|nr:hypothetical protein [Micromonosporaceae bacterium]